jgi:hypothetical protein
MNGTPLSTEKPRIRINGVNSIDRGLRPCVPQGHHKL